MPLRTYDAPGSVGLPGVKSVWSLALQPELRLVKEGVAEELLELAVLDVREAVVVARGRFVAF